VVSLTETGTAEYYWLKLIDIQTMPDFQPNFPTSVPILYPQLMQVAAPSTALYQRCDIIAPMISTLGYGSGAWAVDFLPETGTASSGWLHLCDDAGRSLGWSQASRWQVANSPSSVMRINRLGIDRHTQTMTIYQDDEAAAAWAVSTSTRAWKGDTVAISRGVRLHRQDRPLTWTIRLANGIALGGADWHNEFGTPRETASIEMHPYLAKWLYHHLADGATIDII
jgi:hypothetical protein